MSIAPPNFPALRAVQQLHMWDTIRRQQYSRTINDAGQPVETWSEVAVDLDCGYEPQNGAESSTVARTIVTWDATIRLPVTTVLDPKDRVLLTRTKRETLSPPILYSIVGPVQTGPTALLVRLRKVEV